MELQRHVEGRESFALFLDRWIRQSTLSDAAFCKAANSLLGSNRLHGTQLSGLRNGLCKQISVYTFDALGALATAAYKHHKEGKDYQRDNGNLNLIPFFGDEEGPFGMAEVVEMFVGIRETPQLPDEWLGVSWEKVEGDQPAGVLDIGLTIRRILQRDDGDLLDNLDSLMAHYPSKDEARQLRFKSVVLGLAKLTREESQTETLAACMALTAWKNEPWDVAKLARQA